MPNLDETALAVSRDRAATLISRFSIPQINIDTLASWEKDDARTLYLFDVRTVEEYSDGHIAGASHAPGGQLVQATDLPAWTIAKRMLKMRSGPPGRGSTP